MFVSALTSTVRRGKAACVRALVAAKGIGHSIADCEGRTALHVACEGDLECTEERAEIVSLLLVAGSCRFALCEDSATFEWRAIVGPQTRACHVGQCRHAHADAPRTETALSLAGGNEAVRAVFLAGVDYWQRSRHGGHSWAMRRVVRAIMLARQRLDARARAAADDAAWLHLPEEIWLLVCGFLRSADFGPRCCAVTGLTRPASPGAAV